MRIISDEHSSGKTGSGDVEGDLLCARYGIYAGSHSSVSNVVAAMVKESCQPSRDPNPLAQHRSKVNVMHLM